MRLIDADALKTDYIVASTTTNTPCYRYYSEEQINNAPTIEAEPIRHGHWTIKAINKFELSYGATGYEPVYQCSECGGVEESYLRVYEPIMPEDADFPRYCPNCGAKMDLKEVEE